MRQSWSTRLDTLEAVLRDEAAKLANNHTQTKGE
jgi:hypothetical protein